MVSDAEMFEWAETQRALASSLTDAELAAVLIGEVMASVGAAAIEYDVTKEDSAERDKERGALREAAYRLAKLREYEPK